MDAMGLLRLVSEETRNRLLQALRRGERTVTALVAELQDEQSNVSHHLKTLRDAGLVASRREGRAQVYRLADPAVERLLAEVEGLAGRLDRVAYTSRLGLPVDAGFHGYG
ncbi:MAG TPA: metalloregulator ArsR/SmtB family transcription factor [Candidatus Thermoplasmatota archaeon]|nr:metalloregulator ArsR/SmtB family transcription factor [Candidatus Thermoplasmatota archaeon]